jgi:hypothetical protein
VIAGRQLTPRDEIRFAGRIGPDCDQNATATPARLRYSDPAGYAWGAVVVSVVVACKLDASRLAFFAACLRVWSIAACWCRLSTATRLCGWRWSGRVLAVGSTLMLIGCAQVVTQRSPPTQQTAKIHASVRRVTGDATPLPEPALLARQPQPDCEFKTAATGVDGNDARVTKLDYEQQCYRQAEGIVRTRLGRLQASIEVTIKAIKGRKARKFLAAGQ